MEEWKSVKNYEQIHAYFNEFSCKKDIGIIFLISFSVEFDPTSHITGGAISRAVRNSIRVLEYAGFDPIIIESVGAGQTKILKLHIKVVY